EKIGLLGLACLADARGELHEAVAYLERARKLDPQDATVEFAIGYCHERSQESAEKAQTAYQKSVELCPRLRNGWERLAALAVTQASWTEAMRCYEMLTQLEPDDLDVWVMLG